MINHKRIQLNTAAITVLYISIWSCTVVASTNSEEISTGQEHASLTEPTMFSKRSDIIPFENRARRKWDNAVIADLDQDSRQDVLITEHGQQVKVFWNNGDSFSKPQPIARGDLHGIAVADFNGDGRIDLVIAQGGGDGNNPRRPEWYSVNHDRTIEGGKVFDYFQPGRGRAIKFIDGGNKGQADLVVTGFPLSNQKEGANHFYEKADDNHFNFINTLPQAKWLGYRTLTSDLDNNGHTDIIFYGGSNFRAIKGLGKGKYSAEQTFFDSELQNLSDMSSISEIDFDNDGDFDLFITRAEAQFDIETYYDEVSKRFAFITFRKEFLFEDLKIEGDLIIENLQRTYTDRNVFVGKKKRKLKFTEEPHGGHNVRLTPEEAAGWPEGTTHGGLYIGYLGDGLWRVGGKTHSRTAATIANVISTPPETPQKKLPVRMLENRNGIFTDVTAKLGISIKEQSTSAAVGDFDNNGWSDIAILRYGSMAVANKHIVYMNQGNGRFERNEVHGIIANEIGTTGGSIEAFDHNLDGAMDLIFSNERGRWHLMQNNLVSNVESNFIIVRVGKSPLKKAHAKGALLTLKACGNTYIRKVGSSSAAFSQGMNTDLHVGLGNCKQVDSASVKWTNNETKIVNIRKLNTVKVI